MEQQRHQQLLGFLLRLFEDPAVDEVLVNGASSLWLSARGELLDRPTPFSSSLELALWAQLLARQQGMRLDPVCGSAGGTLSGHHFRWHCILPPLAQDGPLLSLRRHRFEHLNLDSFSAEPGVIEDLRALMIGRGNLLIAGPTGSGKTTVLATLLATYTSSERSIIIESLPELPLPSACSVRLLERQPNLEQVGAVSLDRLVRESLRMRPDRLVVGEVRGAEAGALCEALMTGHDGVLATIHANHPKDALVRLSFLASGSGRRHSVEGWSGLSLSVLMMERGQPPKIVSLSHHRFVPSG